MTTERESQALPRTNREIAELQNTHDSPALLVTLGIEDWEAEKRLILLNENGTAGMKRNYPTLPKIARFLRPKTPPHQSSRD